MHLSFHQVQRRRRGPPMPPSAAAMSGLLPLTEGRHQRSGKSSPESDESEWASTMHKCGFDVLDEPSLG